MHSSRRRSLIGAIIMVLVAPVCVGQTPDGDAALSSIWPSTVGTRWVYEIVSKDLWGFGDDTLPHTDTIQVTLVAIRYDSVDHSTIQEWTFDPYYWGYNLDKALVKIRSHAPESLWPTIEIWPAAGYSNLPVIVYELGPKEEHTDRFVPIVMQPDGDTSISAPAGHFNHCQSLIGHSEGSLSGTDVREWLKPGVGIVRSVHSSYGCLGGTEVTASLIDYQVPVASGTKDGKR